MRSRLTPFAALIVSFLLIPPSFAFDTPLSQEAVRDAYFLGQHNDQSTLSFFSQYVRTPLPPPTKGPTPPKSSSTLPTPKSSKLPAAAPAPTAPSKPNSTLATTKTSSMSACAST